MKAQLPPQSWLAARRVAPSPKRGRLSFEGRKGFRLETLRHSGDESEVFQQKYDGTVLVFDYG
jgi:hypothetical protein